MVSKWLRRTVVRRSLFAGVVLLLVATIGWAGWRVLDEDRQAATRRLMEDRQVTADLVAAEFTQRLSNIDRLLDDALTAADWPARFAGEDGLVVRLTADGIRANPEGRLKYYPTPAAPPPNREAESLVRLSVAAVRSNNFASAFEAYDRLAVLGAAPIGDIVGGIPAALYAPLGRLIAYERQHDAAGARAAALALEAALRSGRWPPSAATYEFLHEQVTRVVADVPSDDELATTEAVTWLSEQRSVDPRFPPTGRTSHMFPSGPAVLVWRSSPEAVVAWIANRRTLADSWIPSLKRLTDQRRARVALSTADGPLVGQTLPPDAAVRPASPGLPWTIQVTNSADDAALRDRRWLLLAGMSTLVLLIVSGAWVIERTVTRELAVADLQADFVSAVSHEFRTPLTTLCQLSEMLMRERVASEEDRRQYYAFLHGESQRLRRLVEALLNFGRLEAGRMEFHFCATDVDGFVGDIVDEFSASRQALHHRVELAGSGRRVAIRADAGLLKAALWNLLENAAKYSPDADTIWVSVQATPDAVIVSVRDRGVGIPVVERATIFEKFVRGAATRANGIGGTGVGLAMARRIVEAHGGTITVASEVGRGSTFTMTLPLSTSGIQADDDLPQRSGWPGMAGIR